MVLEQIVGEETGREHQGRKHEQDRAPADEHRPMRHEQFHDQRNAGRRGDECNQPGTDPARPEHRPQVPEPGAEALRVVEQRGEMEVKLRISPEGDADGSGYGKRNQEAGAVHGRFMGVSGAFPESRGGRAGACDTRSA